MIEKDYKQWQSVMQYLQRRSEQHADRLVGRVESDFDINRKNLLATIGHNAQRVAESYDREAESLKVAQEVQKAVFQTAAVQVGAIGLGAVLVAVLQGVWLDMTGLLGASAVAALGLYVLPNKRKQVKSELRKQAGELRQQLNHALTSQFENELRASKARLEEAIAPYTRFVRVEREKLEKMNAELERLRTELTAIRNKINALGAAADAAAAEPVNEQPVASAHS